MRGKKTEARKRRTTTVAGTRREPARSESGLSVAPRSARKADAAVKAPDKPKRKSSAGAGRRAPAGEKPTRKTAAKSPRSARRPSAGGRGRRRATAAAVAVTPQASRAEERPEMLRVLEEARALAERPSDRAAFPEEPRLPAGYGKDRIVAMVRDPYWVHAYWELTPETVSRGLRALGKDAPGAKRVLRVYSADTNAGRPENFLFDVALTPDARNWYINVGGPGRAYRVEIGLLARAGKYVCLAASNVVSMPPDRMSDLLDEEWADLSQEYYAEMYALSGGLTGPSSAPVTSPGLAERLARRLEERLASPVFSPGVSAGMGARALEQPFWLRLDADLIVYGATVPGSRLTVEGGTCSLREDGTFSFRCHLPDGRKDVKVTSRSADGAKEERIELTVTRSTK